MIKFTRELSVILHNLLEMDGMWNNIALSNILGDFQNCVLHTKKQIQSPK